MKCLFAISIFLLSFKLAFAIEIQQNNVIDSLEKSLKVATQKEKPKILNSLAYSYWNINQKKAIESAKQAYEIALQFKNVYEQANSLNHIGLVCNSEGKYQEAIRYHNKSLSLRKTINDQQGIAYSLNNLGMTYSSWSSYDKSLEYFRLSLDLKIKLNDKTGIANTLNHIGNIYFALKNYNQAISFYQKSLKIKQEQKYERGIAYSYQSISEVYLAQNKLEQALNYAKQAYRIFSQIELKQGEELSCKIIGQVYLLKNQESEASKYINQAIFLAENLGNKKESADLYGRLGEVYFAKKDYEKSMSYNVKSLKIAESINVGNILLRNYELFYKYYQVQKNYKKAFDYLMLYNVLKDSIFNSSIEQKISGLNLEYDLSRKENELLLQQKKIKELELQRQIQIQNYYIVVIIFILILSSLLYLAYSNKRKTNNLLRKDIVEREEFEENLKLAKEKAEEADNLKSAFLANMSHEIRTPLNGIMGFADLLKNKKISSEKRDEYIEIINSSSEHLLALINDIIDISKIEAQQLKIANSKFELNDIMNELNILYKDYSLRNNKQAVTLSCIKGFPDDDDIIITDQLRLRQILINLISNALKFTDKGFVYFGYEMAQDNKLIFYVKDSGIGIAIENIPHVFERFRQVEQSDDRIYGGTGLGLTISKNLVQLLGGEIWVHSELGKGSEFFFTIPYKRS